MDKPKRKPGRPRQSLPTKVKKYNAFAIWLHRSGETVENVAKVLGVCNPTAYKWRNGTRRPTMDAAVAIEKMSHGEVPVASWCQNIK